MSFNLCSRCLGDENNLRMIKLPQGEKCKICIRPFDVYRWQVDDGSVASKKTVICTTCSSVKNCCQCCMLDINFLIPLDIRDTALKMSGLGHLVHEGTTTRNDTIKGMIADKQDGKYNIMENEQALAILNKLATGVQDPPKPIDTINNKKFPKSLTSTVSSELSKIIKKLPFNGSLTPPNEEITSFFLFGITPAMPQYIITDYCGQFGKLKSITIIHNAQVGFISFTKRTSAEAFAEMIKNNGLNPTNKGPGLVILEKKYPIRVVWSEPQPLGHSGSEHKKIAMVVNKVMAQLAQSNSKSKSKSKQLKSNDSTSSNPTKDDKDGKPPKKQYQAAHKDFEL